MCGSTVASSQTYGDIAGDWSSLEWYECSCGVRDGDASTVGRATGRTWRAVDESGRWLHSEKDKVAIAKLYLRDQDNKPLVLPKKPIWLVCRNAKGIDDRAHAFIDASPGDPYGKGTTVRAMLHCICGGGSSFDDEIKQVPVESVEKAKKKKKS
jgi:hypothetical protein